jgi:hypothetical protein
MRWTNIKPTQEGWYWYRTVSRLGNHCAKIEFDENNKLHARIMCADYFIDNLDGEWAGPIPEPEEY